MNLVRESRRFLMTVAWATFLCMTAAWPASMARAYQADEPAAKATVDAAAPDTAATPAADAALDAAAPAATPPPVPPYFSGANPENAPEGTVPAWPDPTGMKAGSWATPAGDGTADVPSKINSEGLYDRIAHNLFSINMVWTLITGFLVMFMQTGFSMVEGGLSRARMPAIPGR